MNQSSHVSAADARLTQILDLYAAGLSSLCLLHCIALPLLVTLLPVTALLLGSHWIHPLFVLLAIPATLSVIWRARPGWSFLLTALSGLSLLTAAAFIEALVLYETPITTSGALLLAVAHLRHWAASNREQQRSTV